MRLSRRGARRGESRLLWVNSDDSSPPYLVESARRAGNAVRDLRWDLPLDGERSFGRLVEFGDRTGREYPMSVKLVSPRLLLEFAAPPRTSWSSTSSGWSGCTRSCPSCSGRTR